MSITSLLYSNGWVSRTDVLRIILHHPNHKGGLVKLVVNSFSEFQTPQKLISTRNRKKSKTLEVPSRTEKLLQGTKPQWAKSRDEIRGFKKHPEFPTSLNYFHHFLMLFDGCKVQSTSIPFLWHRRVQVVKRMPPQEDAPRPTTVRWLLKDVAKVEGHQERKACKLATCLHCLGCFHFKYLV